MIQKERLWDLAVIISIIMIIFIPSVFLFFLDGGQIRGINDDPATRPNLTGKNIDGLTFTPAPGNIQPIYDDTEIVPVSFWQLSPREMMLRIITYPMAHIPLSTGKLLSLLYLASGLSFLLLYQRSTKRNDPDAASRREIIRTYITEHPGKRTQQIADALSLPRSTLTYHLRTLQKAHDIIQIRYGGQPYFFPANTGLSDVQRILYLLLRIKANDPPVLRTILDHPGITRSGIAALIGLAPTSVEWYILRLKHLNLITTDKQNRAWSYRPTPATEIAYRNHAEEYPRYAENAAA